uniref:G_PROTEIN_RECEP_F1_2 domain-containing protein n=1 Tax=Strongyloides papillosus TaxID=174720 RepID=A0A0N5BMN9_STREA
MGTLATLENWKFVLIDVFINSIIYSTTIIVSIYKYVKYIKRVSSKMSEVTKKLHLDFLKFIIFQSSVPFIITFTSIFIFLIYAQLGYSNKIPFIGDILIKFMCAVPSINAILYIFLSSKNRNKFFLIVKNTLQRKSLSNISEPFIISSQRYSIDPITNIKGSRVNPCNFSGYTNLHRNSAAFYSRKVNTV